MVKDQEQIEQQEAEDLANNDFKCVTSFMACVTAFNVLRYFFFVTDKPHKALFYQMYNILFSSKHGKTKELRS